MAGQWIEDPSWGNIFGNIATQMSAAPGQALQQIELVDKIKRERASQAAGVATGNAYEQTLPTAPPMGTRDVVGPMVGDINSPIDTQGMPTATIPALPDARTVATFNAKRALAVATARQAALLGKTSEMFPLMAQGQIATGGLPDDQTARDTLQAQLTGNVREQKATPFIVMGPDGTPIAQGASSDNFKTDLSGKPIVAPPGGSIQMSSPTPPGQSIYGNKDLQMQELVRLENKVRSGQKISEDEVQRGGILLDSAFPQKGEYQTVPGGRQYQVTRPQPVPDAFSSLNGLVSAYRNNDHLKPPQQQQPPAPQPPAPPPAGLTGTPTAVAPAPPPEPIVPPQVAANLNDPKLGPLLAEPAKAEQIKDVRAVAQASSARQTIESAIGLQNGQLPAKPYLPSLAAAMVNERGGQTVAGRYLLGTIDPKAKEYYNAAKLWVEPVLRIASGAAIRPEEYAEYYGMFIPEAGDSQAQVAQKLNAMRLWENATAGAQNANEVLTKMAQTAQGNPSALALVERLRVKAAEAGTLNAPVQSTGTAAVPPVTTAPAATAPAAVDHARVKQLLGIQ